MNFTIAVLAIPKLLNIQQLWQYFKAPRRGFGNSPKIRWLADLKLNEVKGCLGGGLHCPSTSVIVIMPPPIG